jgi:hypothetical protein
MKNPAGDQAMTAMASCCLRGQVHAR